MTRPSRLATVALAAVSIGMLDGCRRKPAAAPTPVATVNQDSIARAQRAAQEEDAQRRAAAEEADRRRAEEDRRRADAATRDAATARVRETLTATVYFDYDADNLRDDTRAALDAKAAILLANPTVSIRIAGHTDERGETEYNFALGQRRAASAKRYLVQQGIDAGRIETVSFGEEQPASAGGDESAYAQNRRAVFVIASGGATLVGPRP